jgi:hypothetical protein
MEKEAFSLPPLLTPFYTGSAAMPDCMEVT